MPKLQGIEEKYINNIKVDKENDECFFNDETHTYYKKDTMQKYISVTTLISRYCEEFNEDFWSSYKALEALMDFDTWLVVKKALLASKKFSDKFLTKFGIDEAVFYEKKQEILDLYAAKRAEACEHGTAVHLQKELSFYGRKNFDFGKYGYADVKGEFDCRENYYKLDLDRGVYPEFLLAVESKDKLLRVSGQIDLLIKDGNDIRIIDWKSNSEIKKESYYNRATKTRQMMKYPLNNLQDCTLVHYQLQLSLYAYMLQVLHPEFNIKGLKLIHIDREQKETEYELPYLKDDVERMLKHYKKQLKIQAELDKDKPYL